MDKEKVYRKVFECGVVPVVRAESAEQALKIAEAIKAGGVDVIEITMTVPGAVEVIRELSQRFGQEVTIGAGTVLDPETAKATILAGARFVVGPTLNLDVIKLCRRYNVLVVAGALSPTEILTAWEAGADIVKVFPASNVGGPKYIKAIKGPLPQVALTPTGGVNLQNAGDFIKAGAVFIGVGGDLVDRKAVKEGRYEVLTENARKFAKAVKEARP